MHTASLTPRFAPLHRLYLWLSDKAVQRENRQEATQPAHLQTGERGEDLAFFYLRSKRYTVVARRWHAARCRGDLDLVAWDGDTLVIVEVKTRTARDFAPAEASVDRDKQRTLRRLALAYRHRIPEPWRDHTLVRFDIVSVYDLPSGPEFEHTRSAFPLFPSA